MAVPPCYPIRIVDRIPTSSQMAKNAVLGDLNGNKQNIEPINLAVGQMKPRKVANLHETTI